jgi:hypothetical protein
MHETSVEGLSEETPLICIRSLSHRKFCVCGKNILSLSKAKYFLCQQSEYCCASFPASPDAHHGARRRPHHGDREMQQSRSRPYTAGVEQRVAAGSTRVARCGGERTICEVLIMRSTITMLYRKACQQVVQHVNNVKHVSR